MATSIYDILDSLRASALDERDKGDKFEELVKAFLETDPEWQQRFSEVEFFSKWELNTTGKDIGIDLVAKNRYDDGWSAIQCKFYDEIKKVAKGDIDSFLSISYRPDFNITQRYIFDTAAGWSNNAEETLKGQVQRVDISFLEESGVDWSNWSIASPTDIAKKHKNDLLPHQREALDEVTSGLEEFDRGRMIMACGTGKTFTALRLAERQVGKGGTVLFLVPSIQLLSQSLREWMAQTEVGIRPFAVCSDVRVGRRSANNDELDLSTVDLTEPPTTDSTKLVQRFKANNDPEAMTVVFSTYQSIDVIIDAQKNGLPSFDLVICDEAHRTSGVSLKDEERKSPFLKIHDQDLVKADKRIYMTATPRVFDDNVRRKADDAEAVLFDMSDESIYGPELHRLGFSEAVERDLLTDYKVLVLAVDEKYIAEQFQKQWGSEIPLDDIAKLVGCWNGLGKNLKDDEHDEAINDWRPMKTAVAFAQNIATSKAATTVFPEVSREINKSFAADDARNHLTIESKHVDGTMGIHERNSKLAWLKQVPEDNSCRILTNAKCLSEGVDVPALDAVLFLTPRGSQVDVVQSVGRVMRKSDNKELGYIILPVVIPSGMAAEDALNDNERYKVVWQVLQALRSHDDRFNAEINKIALNKGKSKRISVIGVTAPSSDDSDSGEGTEEATQEVFQFSDQEIVDAMYARIVKKVGERQYWARWATEVAEVAEKHIARIQGLLSKPHSKQAREFKRFLKGLRGNLNENITETEAIEMLAQHLITRPIFDRLFEDYDFASHNPVAQVMERMLAVLDEKNLADENQALQTFYDKVSRRVDGVDNAEGKQKILIELYDNFFKVAFKRSQEKLGIVYTPVEAVDFILRSADAVLKKEFGQSLTEENVHILDGFTGTGTFLVRLMQSGLIKPEDLPRKYANELHGNEILLLAYYIACINLETTYKEIAGETKPFEGLVLTDTFQSWEPDDRPDLDVFLENNARLEALKKLKITVIVGNPPYSSGQGSANDDNANESYPALDNEIRSTYAELSTATNKNSLYDSYIRAIKWATLRIHDRGVVAYISNGGWLDSNTADGMRKTLSNEFSSIYIWNLKGNARAAGEQRRKEGGGVFKEGSRATVAISLFVKNPGADSDNAQIHYTEIADYLDRETKLKQIAGVSSVLELPNRTVTANVHGDWVNQRRDDFETFQPISVKKSVRGGIFSTHGDGIKTNRDAWAYNSSHQELEGNISRMVSNFNSCVVSGHATTDEALVSWSRALRRDFEQSKTLAYEGDSVVTASYRPFFRQFLYFNRSLNDSVSIQPSFFRTGLTNIGYYITGSGAAAPFTTLAIDSVPDLVFPGAGNPGQFFARYRYEPIENDDELELEDSNSTVIDGYRKIDNITDEALKRFASIYPAESISKDDIFYYVYGLLHSSEYRETYAADLKKMLPRIPFVKLFSEFATAGRKLSDLHLNYENVEPYPLGGLGVEPLPSTDPYEFFAVQKTKFAGTGKNKDKSTIIYNDHIMLSSIPEDAYRYMLGSRSAIEWLMDRYQVKVDSKSGIKNDPNDWSREVGDPRYILDLFARITTVSVETMKIVDGLPELEILDR